MSDARAPIDGSRQTALVQQPESVVAESVPTASVLGEDITVTYWDGAAESALNVHVGVARDDRMVLSDADDPVSGAHYMLRLDGPQRENVYITDGSDGTVLGPVTDVETSRGGAHV